MNATHRLGKSESIKRWELIIGSGLFVGFVDNKKNTE